jgi:LPS sulfotransferase NodH
MAAAETPAFPLFVVGSGRSGTTLLYSILNAHPHIRLQNEANIVAPVLSQGLDLSQATPAAEALDSIARSLPRKGRGRAFLENSPVAKEMAHGRDPMTLPALFEALLKGSEPRPIWGEKSLQLGFVLGQLLAMFPEARIVHLVRDPRDTVLSFCEKRRAGPDSVAEPDWPLMRFYAREWDLTQRAIETANPARRLLLRYEQLAKDPEGSVAEICAFLGVAFEPRMLDPAVWQPNLSEQEWQAHRHLRDPVLTTQVGRSAQLSPTLLKCIEDRAATMERYGYQRAQAPGFSGRQLLLACRYVRHVLALRKQSRPLKLAKVRRA